MLRQSVKKIEQSYVPTDKDKQVCLLDSMPQIRKAFFGIRQKQLDISNCFEHVTKIKFQNYILDTKFNL